MQVLSSTVAPVHDREHGVPDLLPHLKVPVEFACLRVPGSRRTVRHSQRLAVRFGAIIQT